MERGWKRKSERMYQLKMWERKDKKMKTENKSGMIRVNPRKCSAHCGIVL